MKHLKRLCILLIISILCLEYLSGCSGNKNTVKVGKTELSSGIYYWFLVKAYDDACYESGGKENLWGKEINKTPVKKWITDKAKLYVAQYELISEKFIEYGLVLSDSNLKEIDSTVESYWNASGYYRYYEKYHISQENFKDIITCNYKSDMILNKMKDDLGKNIRKNEIYAYMKNNGYLITYISVPMKEQDDNEGSDEKTDKNNNIKTVIDYDAVYKKLSDQIKNGENINNLVKEVFENKEWKNSGIASSYKDDLTDTLFLKNDSSLSAEFLKDLESSQEGTVRYFNDNAQSYRIIYKKEDLNEEWKGYPSFEASVKSILINNSYSKELDDLAKEKKVTVSKKLMKTDLPALFK